MTIELFAVYKRSTGELAHCGEIDTDAFAELKKLQGDGELLRFFPEAKWSDPRWYDNGRWVPL